MSQELLAFVDLDSTLVSLPAIEEACRRIGQPGKYTTAEHMGTWYGDYLPEEIRSQVLSLYSDPAFMLSPSPYPLAGDLIRTLKDLDYEVTICTCRPSFLQDGTRKLVRSLFPGTDVVFADPSGKTRTFQSHRPKIVIDDCPMYIAQAVAVGIPHIYMRTGPDTPYNHALRGAQGLRCMDLDEIIEDLQNRGPF